MDDSLVEESRRLAALYRYRVLDTAPEPQFDAIARQTAETFKTSIALISLVDEHRQWFKARVGLDVEEGARDTSFCTFCIQRDDVMVVPDTTIDVRFKHAPMVANTPGIRFYAGAPLVTADGQRIGTLCVLDREPHEPFTAAERQTLEMLAALVMAEIELSYPPSVSR